MSGRPKQTLGSIVKSARSKKGWSMRELAKRADISASYVSSLEKGRATPAREVAARLAFALELDPELLASLTLDPLLKIVDWEALVRTAPVQTAVILMRTKTPIDLFWLKVYILRGLRDHLSAAASKEDLKEIEVCLEVSVAYIAHMSLANLELQIYATSREVFLMAQKAAGAFSNDGEDLTGQRDKLLEAAKACVEALDYSFNRLAELSDMFDMFEPFDADPPPPSAVTWGGKRIGR